MGLANITEGRCAIVLPIGQPSEVRINQHCSISKNQSLAMVNSMLCPVLLAHAKDYIYCQDSQISNVNVLLARHTIWYTKIYLLLDDNAQGKIQLYDFFFFPWRGGGGGGTE